jgi:hypothetical protein
MLWILFYYSVKYTDKGNMIISRQKTKEKKTTSIISLVKRDRIY